MFVLYVVLIAYSAGKGQAMTDSPQNAAVVVGQTVTFNCRTESSNSVWWNYKAIGSKEDTMLFNSENRGEYDCDNCFVINTEPGQYDLQITNTKQSDAGTYICVETNETSTNASILRADGHATELIVLASVPDCGSNTSLLEDNGSVWIWCIINYRGNIAPVMEWRNKANNETMASLITYHQNSRVKSEIVIQLKHDDDRRIVYSCTTFFNQSYSDVYATSIQSAAKNIPEYTYTWTWGNESQAIRHTSSLDSLKETTAPLLDKEPLTIPLITTLLAILLMFLILCIIFLKPSRKGCFKKVSFTGPIVISHATAEGISNVFYEDPHGVSTSPTGGERTNNAIRVYYEDPEQILHPSSLSDGRGNASIQFTQAPERGEDHVYSLEPFQNSNRLQHGRLQDNIPSQNAGAFTRVMFNVGGGGHGRNEEAEVDILRNINQSEDRHHRPAATAVNDGAQTQRQIFNVGRDGTVYAQVNMGRGGGSHVTPTIQQPTPIQSMFNTSVYASIDHTPPELPPALTTRRN